MTSDGLGTPGRDYFLHSLVLRSHSPWFRAVLESASKAPSRKLELVFEHDPAYEEALELIFDYLYTHEIDISVHSLGPILQMAHKLQIPKIIDHCVDFIKCVLPPRPLPAKSTSPPRSIPRQLSQPVPPPFPGQPRSSPPTSPGPSLSADPGLSPAPRTHPPHALTPGPHAGRA